MVSAIIFLIHIIFAIYVFFKNKKEGISEGFLAVALVIIIFAVGWALLTLLVNLIFSIEFIRQWYWQPLNSYTLWKIRQEFTSDAISLTLLTICESFIYYFLFFSEGKKKKKK